MSPVTRRVGPRACIEENPTHQTIRFGGRSISLIELAKQGGLNHSYLSRIFAGKRRAGVDYLERVAEVLGMGLEEFRACLKELVIQRNLKAEQQRHDLD